MSTRMSEISMSSPALIEERPGWPSFTAEEADAAARVLLSNRVNYWTGEEGKFFEREFAAHFGAGHGIAMANGTVAIDAALLACGVGPGDEVIVPPRTYIASVSSVVNVGATPVFADVDLDSQNLTLESVERSIGDRTRAIMCVHLAGWPCEMREIIDMAERRSLTVIEDCAQSHGATLHGKFAGTWGQVASWSFCQDKIMTTGGEGGMVTTDDELLWKRMWALKDHGKSWEAVYERSHSPGFRWLHESFGSNWRMTEMQAAIGRLQLRRLADWVGIRRGHAERIWEACKHVDGLRVPAVPSHVGHAAYKCYVFVEPDSLASGWNRDRIMNEIVARGVPAFSGSCSEVYLEVAFKNTPFVPARRLPNAAELGETSLMFLVHPTLRDADVDTTIEVVQDVMRLAVR